MATYFISNFIIKIQIKQISGFLFQKFNFRKMRTYLISNFIVNIQIKTNWEVLILKIQLRKVIIYFISNFIIEIQIKTNWKIYFRNSILKSDSWVYFKLHGQNSNKKNFDRLLFQKSNFRKLQLRTSLD